MSFKSVIYVKFDEKKLESFFNIPKSFDELKFRILEQWDEEFENIDFIIENDENKEIKNDNDLIELLNKQKNNKIVVHIKSMIINNNDINNKRNIVEKSSKYNLFMSNISNNVINKKNGFQDLNNNDNIIFNKIQELSQKVEKFTKEIEKIKEKNINYSKEINNLSNSINNINRELIQFKNKNVNNNNIKLKVFSNEQDINLESLLTNNSFYIIKIKNLSNIPLKKGFILNYPKNENSILYIDDYDLFSDKQLNVGEEREFFIPLLYNIDIRRYPKKTTFTFTITNNKSFEEKYDGTINIHKK
jgi:hypothetical protein